MKWPAAAADELFERHARHDSSKRRSHASRHLAGNVSGIRTPTKPDQATDRPTGSARQERCLEQGTGAIVAGLGP